MKKSLIAGAGVAALSVAALPMSVFAATTTTTSQVDNISVGVLESCEFSSTGSTGGTFTKTDQTPGTLVDFGTQKTTLVINCSDVDGYTITPTMTSLTRTSGDTAAITYSATTAQAGSQTWSAAYSLNGTAVGNFTSGTAISGTTSWTDSYEITYLVGLDEDQPAGTYGGTATYALQAK